MHHLNVLLALHKLQKKDELWDAHSLVGPDELQGSEHEHDGLTIVLG